MDPEPTPDPIPFFSDLKDAKKLIFSIFFLLTYPRHIFSLKKLLDPDPKLKSQTFLKRKFNFC
jgi:hypothetical protein